MMRYEPSRTLYSPLRSPLRGKSFVESRFDASQSSRSTIRFAVVRSRFSSFLEAGLRRQTEYNYKPRHLRIVRSSVPRSPLATAFFCRRSRLRTFSFITKSSSGSPNISTSFSSTALETIRANSFLLICTTVLGIDKFLLSNILISVDSFNQVTRAARTYNNQKEDAPHLYMSWSLHCDLSPASELRACIAPNRNDFFLHHVICHSRRTAWIASKALTEECS